MAMNRRSALKVLAGAGAGAAAAASGFLGPCPWGVYRATITTPTTIITTPSQSTGLMSAWPRSFQAE